MRVLVSDDQRSQGRIHASPLSRWPAVFKFTLYDCSAASVCNGAYEHDVPCRNAQAKRLVIPEHMAYLKWLIYTAAFKVPNAAPQGGQLHTQLYINWVDTFSCKEDTFRRKRLMEQLEIWYARFPPSKKRGRTQQCQHVDHDAEAITKTNRRRSTPLDDPDEVHEGCAPGPAPGGGGAGGDVSAVGKGGGGV